MFYVAGLFYYDALVYRRKRHSIEFENAMLVRNIGPFEKGDKFLKAVLHVPSLTMEFYGSDGRPIDPPFSVSIELAEDST